METRLIAKPDSTFRQETNNNQDNKWEKPKSPGKRKKKQKAPTWEPTTSDRFDCLNVENEPKHDLDSNDPIQIKLTNVKLKRKIQYLQSKVKDSQPTAEITATGNFKPRTTSARCLSESTNAISSTSQSLQEEQKETLHRRSTGYYRSSRNMHKKRNNDVYIVGDSKLNGLDERKMKKCNGNVKVRAHPGATVTDMLDYLKPISRKQPSHLILHAGTNDIKSQTPVEIFGNFERVKDMIANESPETRLVISSLILRNDNIELNSKIRSLNESLRKFCVDNDMT